jgi:hypothetical protein
MSVTLSDGTDTVTLHPDTNWSDELNWHPVEQTATRTVTGALVISAAARIAGRPITLESSEDAAWEHRSTVVGHLRNWAAVPGKVLVLKLRGVFRDVIFRHHDGVAFEANPVALFRDDDISDDDFYRYVLRLMEI